MAVNDASRTRHRLERLGTRVAEAQELALVRRTRPSISATLEAVRRRRLDGDAQRRWTRLRTRSVLLAASVLVVVAVFWASFDRRVLHFEVAGHAGDVGEWIAAPDAAPASIGFADGSVVVLHGGGRARVASVNSHGARVVLEQGTAGVHVIPRPGNQWSFVGGPFEVAVIGTQFDISWNPEKQALDIELSEGHVRVRSHCMNAERDLYAPSSFHEACSSPGATSAAPPVPSIVVSEQLQPVPADSVRLEVPPLPTVSARPYAPLWRIALREGDSQRATELALQWDISALASSATPNELVELGSAARLAGNATFATNVYRAIRTRHPRTSAAASAAFHLGRMAFDGRGAWDEAASWFGVYLGEQSGGPFAAEALGRSIECAVKSGESDRARGLSQQYLRRFPKGAHSELARRWSEQGSIPTPLQDASDGGAKSP